jgi:hypothetical protein
MAMKIRKSTLTFLCIVALTTLWVGYNVIIRMQRHVVGNYYYSWHDGVGIIIGQGYMNSPNNGVGPDVVWYELHGQLIIGETRDGPDNPNMGGEKYGYFIYDTRVHRVAEGLGRPQFLIELEARGIPVPSRVR